MRELTTSVRHTIEAVRFDRATAKQRHVIATLRKPGRQLMNEKLRSASHRVRKVPPGNKQNASGPLRTIEGCFVSDGFEGDLVNAWRWQLIPQGG